MNVKSLINYLKKELPDYIINEKIGSIYDASHFGLNVKKGQSVKGITIYSKELLDHSIYRAGHIVGILAIQGNYQGVHENQVFEVKPNLKWNLHTDLNLKLSNEVDKLAKERGIELLVVKPVKGIKKSELKLHWRGVFEEHSDDYLKKYRHVPK